MADYQIFATPLREMDLTGVIDDFVSSLLNTRSVRNCNLRFIKAEGRGPIIDARLILSSGQRFQAYFHLPPADSQASPQAKDELAALVTHTDWEGFS